MPNYKSASATLTKAEAALASAIERVEAAGESASQNDYQVLAKAEAAASAAWEDCEQARRAYWRERALELEQKLHETALPILAEIRLCAINAWQQGELDNPLKVCQRMLGKGLPDVSIKSPVPQGLERSELIEKAEEMLW
ncbi:MAG: hypothetical protein CMK32_03865 [Porticoccaceae bacterium]|nr:hypothetical protein [Porticoccaceae bacterium]